MFDPLSKCDLKCLTGINLHEDARTDVSAFLVKYFTLLLWIRVHYLFYYFLLLIFFSLIKPKSLPIYKKNPTKLLPYKHVFTRGTAFWSIVF